MPKSKQTGVKVQLTGEDGNIFAIMGRVQKAMKRAGFKKEAKELSEEVTKSLSYDEALEYISDYVDIS